jgi:DNA-dependent protein kinase catalytic subunit
MNEIFIHTPATCKRRLAIKTYQVVPMTGKVGMIEWLNDTRPLKAWPNLPFPLVCVCV